MVEAHLFYSGDLRCTARHGPGLSGIETGAHDIVGTEEPVNYQTM